jgi:3-deoxy-manno-octulosonate cytidylyltransferase (CMP-KDO synthetase)
MHGHPIRLGIIPARIASSRFPSKVLAPIAGKPLIQRVWEAAQHANLLHRVIIATDSALVCEVAQAFGAEAVMTPASLPSGTDRVFYASQGFSADTIVNLQGDEPLLEGAAIDALIEGLESDPVYDMATLAVPRESALEKASQNVVKIRFQSNGRVEDFSRTAFCLESDKFEKHIGIYAFRKAALERFCSLPPSRREVAERLEQLRALEAGMGIRAVIWHRDTVAVDVPEDVERVESLILEREKGL